MKILALTLIFPVLLSAQAYNWKKALPGAALTFTAGMAWGTHETLNHHYASFKRVFPGANDQFWNPAQSWTNKYENGEPNDGPKFFGSTNFLVWTTDGKHLTSAIHKNTLFAGGIIIAIGDKKPLKYYLLDFLICSAAYSAGFHTTYSLFFEK